jgi:hypothetical protein
MKKVLIVMYVILITQIACNKSNNMQHTTTDFNGKWRMISVTSNISGITISKPLSIQGDVELMFASTNNTIGTFIGNTPTNTIGQSDYSIGANNTLIIHNLLITEVSETSWGNEFVNNIHSTQQYSFENGRTLKVITANKILTFRKLL